MGSKTIVIDDLKNTYEGECLVTLIGVGAKKIKWKEWTIEDVFNNFEELLGERDAEGERDAGLKEKNKREGWKFTCPKCDREHEITTYEIFECQCGNIISDYDVR